MSRTATIEQATTGIADELNFSMPGEVIDTYIAKNIMKWEEWSNGWFRDKDFVIRGQVSTNLDQAWKVVEKIEAMIDLHPELQMDYLHFDSFGEGRYVASFGEYWWAESTTPAHAICLAAIEAYKELSSAKAK